MSGSKINVSVNISDIERKVDSVIENKNVMKDIHKLLYEYCDPYVPQESGNMRSKTLVTPEYVHYNVPYAHYLYRGIKYSPNYFIDLKIGDERVPAFFTPKGTTKTPSGQLDYNPAIAYPNLKEIYNGERPHPHPHTHPNATSYWDKKMMEVNGEEFTNKIKEVIVKELNKNG